MLPTMFPTTHSHDMCCPRHPSTTPYHPKCRPRHLKCRPRHPPTTHYPPKYPLTSSTIPFCNMYPTMFPTTCTHDMFSTTLPTTASHDTCPPRCIPRQHPTTVFTCVPTTYLHDTMTLHDAPHDTLKFLHPRHHSTTCYPRHAPHDMLPMKIGLNPWPTTPLHDMGGCRGVQQRCRGRVSWVDHVVGYIDHVVGTVGFTDARMATLTPLKHVI